MKAGAARIVGRSRGRAGVTIVEYALLLAVVAVLLIAGVSVVAQQAKGIFARASTSIAGVNADADAGAGSGSDGGPTAATAAAEEPKKNSKNRGRGKAKGKGHGHGGTTGAPPPGR